MKVQAKSQVILCSGGINTPKLLMLSGIGDQAQLRTHGIKTVAHSPEVGQNFHDHLLDGGCIWEPKEHVPHCNSAANVAGFIKSQPDLQTPNVNLVRIELPYASDVIAKEFSPPPTSWPCAPVSSRRRAAARSGCARPTRRIAPSSMHASSRTRTKSRRWPLASR